MTSVGVEPQCMVHYTDYSLYHLHVVESLSQLIHLNLFSLACVINIRHFSSHKLTFVGLEPQWYITQPVVFTTRPLDRCWKPTVTH